MLLSNMILNAGLWLSVFYGCNEEPVLTGIEPSSVLKDLPSAQERIENPTPTIYQKKQGVYIDVLYLGGSDREMRQGILGAQLGNLQQSIELPMRQGIQYIYDKGSVYTFEGRIYRLDIELPEPLRRSQTLQLLGFPEQVDKYLITHREYVLENEWTYRRIRMKRQSKDNELVTSVSAWKFYPQEQ